MKFTGRHRIFLCDPTYVENKSKKHNEPMEKTTVGVSSTPRSCRNEELHGVEEGDKRVHLYSFLQQKTSCYITCFSNASSQRIFIKKEPAGRLHLNISGRTKIRLNRFASKEPAKVLNSNIVEVQVRSQFKEAE